MTPSQAKPRLAFVTHVWPYPGVAGQNQRVRYMLEALSPQFHVTIMTYEGAGSGPAGQLGDFADEVRLLPSATTRRARALALPYAVSTGLKRSNYLIGKVELSPRRVAELVGGDRFDIAMFQYWHAVAAVDVFASRRTATCLDMHNVLWRSFAAQWESRLGSGHRRVASLVARRYRNRETAAWKRFDSLVAINLAEQREAETIVGQRPVFYCPMGIEIGRWPLRWSLPPDPIVAFYGGLGSRGVADVGWLVSEVMPIVWSHRPDVRLHIIGAGATEAVRDFETDARVRVLGYVADVGEALATASVVACPFTGTYGFRSRIVEVMATGTPLVCSRDAVYGMGIGEKEGVIVADDAATFAAGLLSSLRDEESSASRSAIARSVAASRFSADATYGRFVDALYDWLVRRDGRSNNWV